MSRQDPLLARLQVQGALKDNKELKRRNMVLEDEAEDLQNQVTVLNEDRETKARLLKEYITAKAEGGRARGNSSNSEVTSRTRGNSQDGKGASRKRGAKQVP